MKLKCNNLTNPLSVTSEDIVLSFEKGKHKFHKFTLGLASTIEKLASGIYDVFTGNYENVTKVRLPVLEQKEGQRIFWHIKTDKYVSETAYFDIAESFLDSKWIAAPQTADDICLFYKKFNLKALPIQAKLIVCGLGFFDGTINGEIFDEHYYKPNFTDYKKRFDENFVKKEKYKYCVVYNTYDLSSFLKEGENRLDFRVSGGYFHNVDRFDAPVWNYGDTRLKFELILCYPSEKKRIVSDESCLVAQTGDFSTLYLGDRIDFSKRELVYKQARILDDEIMLTPTQWTDDIEMERLNPFVVENYGNYKVYDFGKNHTGGIRCFLKGEKGTRIKVRYAEVANEDGTLNFQTATYEEFIDTANIPKTFIEQKLAKIRVEQENSYILSGEKDEVLPLFSWRCYRYVEMSADKPFTVENLTSSFIHMDIEKTGDFWCSEPIFNDIYQKYILTQKNNMHCGVATDCPHREKVPYTGDGHITAKSVLYNFAAEGFYEKWLRDIILAQSIDGFVPNSAPDMATGGGYFWGFAIMRLPEILYRFTGEKDYLKWVYKNMVAWVEYMNTRHTGNYILFVNDKKWLLSDWLSPEEVKINCRYFSTVCYYASVKILCETHNILFGKRNEEFERLGENIRKAINNTFFNKELMQYCNGIQGETVLALYYGIPDEEYVPLLKGAVRKYYLEEKKGYFDTGIVMTPILLQYLTENGMKDIAYGMMTKMDYPSYAYMLKGETTLPEHWSKKWIKYSFSESKEYVVEGGTDVSHCHPMYGSVVEWLFEKVAGLDLSNFYKKVVKIRPRFVKNVKQAKASICLRWGTVSVAYENTDRLLLKIKIPQGVQGEVCLEEAFGSFSVKGENTSWCINADGILQTVLTDGEWIIEGACI